MVYHLKAVGQQGEKLILAEGIKGASQADAAIKYICAQLNLESIRQQEDKKEQAQEDDRQTGF